MQSSSNFRVALPWLALLSGCTASLESSGNGPTSSALGGATAAGAGGGAALSNGAGTGGAGGMTPALPVWSGAVGSWCGPAEKQTIWLTASPAASTCEASSKKVYSTEAEDTSEGLKLELDALSLGTFPAQLTAPARYCAVGGICSDVQVALQVESYAQGQGVKGTWSFTPAGGALLEGRLDASWCAWDDLLPGHPQGERLARDISIKEVAVYQGVKVPIVRDMQAVAERNADLVQNREAMLRVFVEPKMGFQSRSLSARVSLQDGAGPPRRFEQTVSVSGASTDHDVKSTFNIELPKDAFKAGTQYSVELRETSKCTELIGSAAGARFPETGLSPVGALETGPVKVLLVPVRYEADGSGRLPDTSEMQLTQMRQRMYSMYPTTEVLLTVRDAVSTDRSDLGDMLDQMRQLRDSDKPPSDLAYYGMVSMAESFRDYCRSSCTTGIAGFGSQNGTSAAGMGIGFLGAAAGTFVHELGHIYRRPHAPCGGAAGADEAYPYPEGKLGSWGYDLRTRELFDPAEHVDFMSYCSPEWISDYNYQLILERIVVVNQRAKQAMRRVPGLAKTWRTLIVRDDGQTRWGLDLQPQLAPPGDPVALSALDASGAVTEQIAGYVEASDGERAYFVPAGKAWSSIRLPSGIAASYAGVTQNRPFRR